MIVGKQNKRKGLIIPQKLTIVIILTVAIASAFIYTKNNIGRDDGLNPPLPYWPTEGWHKNTPESAGFDSSMLASGLETIKMNYINIHSLMIVRNGDAILDAYFYPYDGSTYHDLASVTKSIMTTLIGIAVDHGELDLDDTVLSFFPDYSIENRNSLKESITVRHLVSMTSGLQCTARPEEVTLEEMMASSDWVQYAINRPLVYEPGTHFIYDSLGMHLLSAILEKATGMTTLEYAEENLFKPLGIKKVHWVADPQGVYRGSGALSLFPEDAAKIGLLFLQKGKWDEQQIVSEAWVKEATSKQISTGSDYGEDYGYGWWISREDLYFFRADGSRGQRILIIPPMNVVIVTTGAGFELDDVTKHIEAAIVDLENPVMDNKEGFSKLESAIQLCGQPPEPRPVTTHPDLAHVITGKTYVFENEIVKAIGLDYNSTNEAIFRLDLGDSSPIISRVGLDGVYRPSISGRPCITKGVWVNENTFTLDYYEGPGISYHKIILVFEGDTVSFEIVGIGKLVGRITNP